MPCLTELKSTISTIILYKNRSLLHVYYKYNISAYYFDIRKKTENNNKKILLFFVISRDYCSIKLIHDAIQTLGPRE